VDTFLVIQQRLNELSFTAARSCRDPENYLRLGLEKKVNIELVADS
jgi:hypothetical protein